MAQAKSFPESWTLDVRAKGAIARIETIQAYLADLGQRLDRRENRQGFDGDTSIAEKLAAIFYANEREGVNYFSSGAEILSPIIYNDRYLSQNEIESMKVNSDVRFNFIFRSQRGPYVTALGPYRSTDLDRLIEELRDNPALILDAPVPSETADASPNQHGKKVALWNRVKEVIDNAPNQRAREKYIIGKLTLDKDTSAVRVAFNTRLEPLGYYHDSRYGYCAPKKKKNSNVKD